MLIFIFVCECMFCIISIQTDPQRLLGERVGSKVDVTK